LDASEATADGPCEGLGQHRLPHAGHIFDEDVALAGKRDEGQLNLSTLANQDARDIFEHGTQRGVRVRHSTPSLFLS
jgi:hypothetical protein